jgi:hypothetical protein
MNTKKIVQRTVRRFEDLLVWQMAIELVKQIYLLTSSSLPVPPFPCSPVSLFPVPLFPPFPRFPSRRHPIRLFTPSGPHEPVVPVAGESRGASPLVRDADWRAQQLRGEQR